jgi:hypothetical protein
MSEEKKDRKRVVSFSQYSMWSSCKKKYKLQYIDKLAKSGGNIHSVFGTSMHETIQSFLKVMYGESKKAALNINLDNLLYENLIIAFQSDQKKMDGKAPCTKEELIEFYKDGQNILHYFTGKLNKFYPKQGYELVAIEYRLEEELKPGVVFWGFIDVVLRDKISGKEIVIDLKTSTKGWSSYKKNDKIGSSQVLLYKKLYSEKENLELNEINVEYQILKRKIDPNSEWPIPRISKFVPANGKPSVNKAWDAFMEFVDYVFDDNGNIRENQPYEANPTRLCDWCVMKDEGYCNSWR